MIKRLLEDKIRKYLDKIPVTAIVGARQVGKTTLAKMLIKGMEPVVFLDLERSSDLQIVEQMETFLSLNRGKTICIDEIQIRPSLFNEMRSFIDNNPDTRFIILGSSSPDLIHRSTDSLAGRIYYFELSSFLWLEVKSFTDMNTYLLRGGMPLSVMAESNEDAFMWLENYVRTFLERDLRNFGFNFPPFTLRRLWQMLAYGNGQLLNYSQLARSMGLSHTTIRTYIDVLSQTFMLRILPPYFANVRKRMVKTPKVYFRDTGVLHALLHITTGNDLLSHPVYGSSWESIVIENVIATHPGWSAFFYRSSNGAEIDLVLEKGREIVAIEIKASTSPIVTRGFWTALASIKAKKAFIIAQVRMPYPLKNGVMVYPLDDFLELDLDKSD